MEQVPAWLEATINAAALATVYIADDWRLGEKSDPNESLPELPH